MMTTSLRECLALCLVLFAVVAYARPSHHHHLHARLLHHHHRHHHHHHETAGASAHRSIPGLTSIGDRVGQDVESAHLRSNGIVEKGLSSLAENMSAAGEDPSSGVTGTDDIPTDIMTLVTETSQKMVSMLKDLTDDNGQHSEEGGKSGGESQEGGERRSSFIKIQKQALRLDELRRRSKGSASDTFNRFFQSRRRRTREIGHKHAL